MAARMLYNHSCGCIIHNRCTKALENLNRYIKMIIKLFNIRYYFKYCQLHRAGAEVITVLFLITFTSAVLRDTCQSFLISVTIGHNLLCMSQSGLPSQVSVTKEFLVTIVITMPVATDIATTFQLCNEIAMITIHDNELLKVLVCPVFCSPLL